MELKPVPELGNKYHYFDDGKVKPSRHYYVIIDNVFTIKEIPTSVEEWITETREDDRQYDLNLYADTTDFVIQGHFENNPDEVQWFIRTIDGGWFSLGGWFSGRLDVDSSIFKWACEQYEMTPEEFLAD